MSTLVGTVTVSRKLLAVALNTGEWVPEHDEAVRRLRKIAGIEIGDIPDDIDDWEKGEPR